MAVTIKHFGKIVNGVKHYYNPKLHEQVLRGLEGKEFEEVIKEKFKRVSPDAHGYYRGGVIGTALECEMFQGWDEDAVHDFFAKMFLSYTKTNILRFPDGSEKVIHIKKTLSTASLSRKEMAEYVDKCIQWLAMQGVIVLTPEEYQLGKYKSDIRDVKE